MTYRRGFTDSGDRPTRPSVSVWGRDWPGATRQTHFLPDTHSLKTVMSSTCTPVRSPPLHGTIAPAHALSTSQAHDWFSDVLTGGLILGLCISYAPQVRYPFL
jgi:hypothetical protein